MAVEPHLGDDETFLATYGDGLTDAPLADMIDAFHESGKTAMFLSVRPQFNAHVVSTDADGNVRSVEDMSRSDVRINGGFFVFKREILDLIEPGDELVEETVRAADRASASSSRIRTRASSAPMDTIKDQQRLEACTSRARRPGGDAPLDGCSRVPR